MQSFTPFQNIIDALNNAIVNAKTEEDKRILTELRDKEINKNDAKEVMEWLVAISQFLLAMSDIYNK